MKQDITGTEASAVKFPNVNSQIDLSIQQINKICIRDMDLTRRMHLALGEGF
jgi:hypothetical protein